MQSFSIGQCVSLACLLEVAAPKPGNVHRAADFEDTSLVDFMASAVAIGPVLGDAHSDRVGECVLKCVEATRFACSSNTNLGIILLLTPLALAAMEDGELPTNLSRILQQMTSDDARQVYAAISLASAGGMKPVDDEINEMNVDHEPPADLLAAMKQASDRDMIALQYVNGFQQIFEVVVPLLADTLDAESSLTDRIIETHLTLMRDFPDSLIRRKLGVDVARESAQRAGRVLDAKQYGELSFQSALADFDFWLRSDGNRRNPGTTADLIAAGLFVSLWKKLVTPPFK